MMKSLLKEISSIQFIVKVYTVDFLNVLRKFLTEVPENQSSKASNCKRSKEKTSQVFAKSYLDGVTKNRTLIAE